MPPLNLHWEFELSPTLAASALLSLLSLPAGAATVWPTTRDGQVKLVVKLDKRFWDRKKDVPIEFEGFSVVVEPSVSISAQSQARHDWTTGPATIRH